MLVPAAVAFLFIFGVAGVLITTLGVLRGKMQSFIAGIVLLSGVSLIVSGANQYADVPVSFFVLATLGLLCLQERYPEDLRFTVLAGLTAGFTAWTKNEGALFLVALILARAWAIVRYGNRTTLIPQFLKLAAGTRGATGRDYLSSSSGLLPPMTCCRISPAKSRRILPTSDAGSRCWKPIS